MRKYLIAFVFLLLFCLFVSCSNGEIINNESKVVDTTDNESPIVDTIDNEPESEVYIPVNIREIYRSADNVYKGKLLSLELGENFYHKDGYGQVNITVDVSAVFKGDYLAKNVVTDVFYDQIGKREDNLEGCGLDIGAEYIFITDGYGRLNSALKVSEDSSLSYYSFPNNERKYKTYEDLVYDMFECDSLEYGFMDDSGEKMQLNQMFGLSENVYFGEVVECTESYMPVPLKVEGYDKSEAMVYRIKVRVLSAAKGSYFPGIVIEDIVFAGYDACFNKEELAGTSEKNGIFFSAKGLIDDKKYKELLGLDEEEWGRIIVKVKEWSVAKGDYVSGQIIEDIIPLNQYATEIYGNSLLCISGDDFFAYYKEMLSGEKAIKDVTSMVFP